MSVWLVDGARPDPTDGQQQLATGLVPQEELFPNCPMGQRQQRAPTAGPAAGLL